MSSGPPRTYQFDPMVTDSLLWAPGGRGLGLPESRTSLMPMGGREYVPPSSIATHPPIVAPSPVLTPPPIVTPSPIMSPSPNAAPNWETSTGSRNVDPLLAEVIIGNRIVQRQFANLEQQITELRQAPPYVSSHSISSVVGMPAPVTVPTNFQRSGLEELYRMSPGLVMPPPLSKDEHPLARFWKKSDWEKWKKRQKETKEPGRRRRGQGMNSSWMEQEDGQRVGDERQQAILRVARQTWVTMRSYKIPFGPFLDTPRPTTDYFAATLESTFLELRLCEDHWKVRRLWMENFSSWNNHRSPEGPETASHHPSTSTAPLYPSTSAVPQHPTEGPQEVPQSEPQSEKFESPVGQRKLVTPRVDMPAPAPCDDNPTPSPSSPTTGEGDHPPDHEILDDRGPQDEPGHASAPGSTTEDAAVTTVSVSSNPPALKTKNPRKRKQFSPSTANTIRGVAERKWTQDNPEGTKEMFRAYFEDLSDEKRQEFAALVETVEAKGPVRRRKK